METLNTIRVVLIDRGSSLTPAQFERVPSGGLGLSENTCLGLDPNTGLEWQIVRNA